MHRKLSSSTYAWYAAARRCITAHFMKHTCTSTATKRIRRRFQVAIAIAQTTVQGQAGGRPTDLPVQAVHGAQVVLRKLLATGAVLLHEVACSNQRRGECVDGGKLAREQAGSEGTVP